jgi:hypothetical protein
MQHLARINCKKHMEQSPFLVVNSRTTVQPYAVDRTYTPVGIFCA